MAKNTALMIGLAYERYKAVNGSAPTTLSVANLTPYMNYINVDSASTIDDYQYSGARACNVSGGYCLKLHNGGYLQVPANDNFGGNATTNLTHAYFDPDGVYSNTTVGADKSLEVVL